MDELAGLAEVRLRRHELEQRELDLIDRARHAGATWAQVAAALGLSSRQAAEQRRQRLRSALRSRQQDQDLAYAQSIAALRTAVLDLHRHLAADRAWDSRFTRAALIRRTLEAAIDAPPGGLFSLTAQALTDLRLAGRSSVPRLMRGAVDAVAGSLRAASPAA
jgi:hypothetical protein